MMSIKVASKNLLKILLLPVSGTLYLASGLVPRRKDLWVFGCQAELFLDNTKHLFIYVTEREPQISAVWISDSRANVRSIRSRGAIAYHRWSLWGLVTALRAKYWFVTTTCAEINYLVSRGSVVVNLWHGTPLKKIYFDSDNPKEIARYHSPSWWRRVALEPFTYRRSQYLVSSSDAVSRRSMSAALGVPLERCLNFGQPRNDILLASRSEVVRFCERWESTETVSLIKKVESLSGAWLYAPTWREANPSFLKNSGLEPHALNERLAVSGRHLMIKLHPFTPKAELEGFRGFSHITVLPSGCDLNLLMPLVDGLVTDYSSIYIDYLLTGRPTIFFAWDLSTFLSTCRGMYYEYSEMAPGPIVTDADDLMEIVCANKPLVADDRQRAVTKWFYDHIDQHSCARITNFFKNDPLQ